MSSLVSRYPGAQPFADDEISRLVFCGRDRESRDLLDLVLAHRLVVVYAKSGLGKTSLLQAGLATPLRDEHCLPLFVRLNDVSQPPLLSLVDQVKEQAARQHVEYRAGSTASLWHFFKTAEFWREDVLLTPVLVLDQFEEVFTRQNRDARARFLKDLGSLVRGVRPEGVDAADEDGGPALTEKAPEVRVLISLREDFLGLLDEAADNIPQILDHRFRLKPLGLDGAAEAMEKPAAIADARFRTQPFRYGQGTVTAVIRYLSRRTDDGVEAPRGHVEPFHLQLICQKAEAIAAERQRAGVRDVAVTFEDLGGGAGLENTLRDFYTDVVRSIGGRSTRRKVRRLCADYLISPMGRRLSVERGEIERLLHLDARTLQYLVDRRLLRSDQRADQWYFELSHDRLVQPILATRRVRGFAFGGLWLVGSAIVGLLALFVPLGLLAALRDQPLDQVTVFAALFVAALAGLALWYASDGIRRGVQTLNRYVGRHRPVWVWLIAAYAAYVAYEWAVEFWFRGPSLFQFLRSLQTAAIVGAAVALVRLRALAVPLLAAGVITTIAASVYGPVVYAAEDWDPVVVATVSALTIALQAAMLAYAWFLWRRRVLR